MAITQLEIANQMIKQLRVLDPSASAEIGTPERKIIDTVAQALADAQVDLSILSGAFDLDAKLGSDLDHFLSVFGFARQSGTFASGVVQFSRDTASNLDIRIPARTQLVAQITGTSSEIVQALFQTTSEVILRAGETVISAPIRSTEVGSFNNVAANTVTTFVGTPVIGITSVTNPTPVVGGQSMEDDNALKVRFRNTIFRNLAGTNDQFLALAVTGAFTNKANVIGPISRFREYLQIPQTDDASSYDVNGDGIDEQGNGAGDEFTTALSTIPYSEYTYDSVPVFLSNGTFGIESLFYMQDVDFLFNTTPTTKNRGDAYRMAQTSEGNDPLGNAATNQPNITAVNVYTGDDVAVQAVRPGDTLVFEHSYVSSASRNDWSRNITNCVDVYINGGNPTIASSVIATPRTGANQFVDSPTNRFHYANFRRLGEPDQRPILGNIFSPLFWSPIIDLPEVLTVDTTTYTRGVHYWPVMDISADNRGTIRARTGIEWSIIQNGQTGDDPEEGPFSGLKIIDAISDSININDYTYDKNVIDLQSGLEGAKQVTTDVLVHQSTVRYFKFDISVMYDPGANVQSTNLQIQNSLTLWLEGLYFGSVIQLSDVLQRVHNTPGVDNVRWSRDVDSQLNCITETNREGVSRLNVVVEETVVGTASVKEMQQVYLTGDPMGGTWDLGAATEIPYNADRATLQAALTAAGLAATVQTSPTPDGSPANPFRIEWNAVGARSLLSSSSALIDGSTIFNEDVFLQDSELPALPEAAQTDDSVAGLIVRQRTQSTWRRG